MQNIFSDALKDLKTVRTEDEVWDVLSGFMKYFEVSSLVYRYLPTIGQSHFDQQIIVEKNYSPNGREDFELINFVYEKEIMEPKLQLQDLVLWKNTVVLPLIYERDNSLKGRFSFDEEIKGIMFPVIADAGRKGVFILTFENSKRIYEPDAFYHLSGVCERAHRALNFIILDKMRAKIHLSTREQQVLEGIIDGRSNLDLAEQTGLSRHTVDAYLRRVFLKVGVKDRTSAAVVALKNSLIPRPSYRLNEELIVKKSRIGKVEPRALQVHSYP